MRIARGIIWLLNLVSGSILILYPLCDVLFSTLGPGVPALAIPALTLFHYLCCVLPAAKVEQLLCGALAALVGSYGQWGAPDAPKLGLSALDKKVQFSRMMSPGVCYRGLKEL